MSANDLFLWSNDFSVRTQEIDEQHQDLIELINRLHVAITNNYGKETTREAFDQLAEKTRTHFLFEESLMRLTHYAGYSAHKNEHDSQMERIRTLQGILDNDKDSGTLTAELLNLDKDWWTRHILTSDRHFGTHYEQSALSQQVNGQPKPDKKWWKFW